MLAELAKRELSLVEVLTLAWEVYCRRFKAIAIVTLVISVPANIIRYLVVSHADRLSSFVFSLNMFLDFLLVIIALMGVALITASAAQEREMNWREALNQAVGSWDRCVAANLLALVIIIALGCLLIIPGIVWSVYYIFVTQTVVLRGVGGKEALAYSKGLVRGRWWKIFLFSLLFLVIGLIQTVISSLIPDYASLLTDTCANVVFAFVNVATTVLFLNLDAINNQRRGEDQSDGC